MGSERGDAGPTGKSFVVEIQYDSEGNLIEEIGMVISSEEDGNASPSQEELGEGSGEDSD